MRVFSILNASRAVAPGVPVRSHEVAAAADAEEGVLSGAGASVELVGITKEYGSIVALQDMTLAVEPGEFLTLLGPSGAGKSTMLMLLAGFVDASAGEIRVDGRNLSRVPAYRRNQGVVFQNYALFPHMTVRENLAYPLAARGIVGQKRDLLITRTVERLRVPELLDRYPHQLSGGQQQRVALARAIVFRPPLLLMDEPLSALDRNLREEMQYELKALHRQLHTTIIFVTHDQGEALTMSDRIAVLQAGRLVQLGTPREIYERPLNSFVARFLGDTNFFEATVCENNAESIEIQTGSGRRLFASAPDVPPRGGKLQAMVRPEALEIRSRDRSGVPFGPDSIGGRLVGRVEREVFVGGFQRYWIRCDDVELCAKVPISARHSIFAVGDEVEIVIHAKDLLLMSD
jgi:putative spermidine/putrescine transport system ATP-binding protein